MPKAILIFICLLLFESLPAQTNSGLRSRLLTSYDGLSSDHVKQTLEDHNGMMWFATTKGLNRYDGKNIQRFRSTEENGKGLPLNDIKTMLLTKSGELWIGTQKGVVKKTKGDKFLRINNRTLGSDVFPSDDITKLMQDENGYIWIATRKGIVIISSDLKEFHSYPTEQTNTDTTKNNHSLLPSSDVADLFQDKSGNIWITTWSVGLTLVIPGKEYGIDNFQFSTLINFDLNLPSNVTFKKIFQDENGKIWLQAAYGIFYRLDIDGYSFEDGLDKDKINIKMVDFGKFDNVQNYVYISKYIDGKGLFVCTASRTYLIPPHLLTTSSNNEFEDILELGDLSSELDTKVDIYVDSRNIVWVASNRGVYSYFGIIDKAFHKSPSYKSNIPNTKISAIYNDQEGVWLGTDKGLFIDDQTKLTEVKNDDRSITYVSSFKETVNGDLWIGTVQGELFQLKSKNKAYQTTKHELPILELYAGNNYIWNILEVNDGVLWLATHTGVFIYNSTSRQLSKWRLPFHGDYDINFNCFDIVKDADNRIYISATGFGLFIGIFNEETGVHDFVHKKQGKAKNEISSNVIFDLEVENNNIWIAQNSGVEVYNIAADSFYRIPILDESVNGQVFSIASSFDKIWFTTPSGLTSYSNKDQAIQNYSIIDGLIDNHSMLGHYTDINGDIYLAGAGGYHHINYESNYNNDKSEELVFSALRIGNDQVNIGDIDQVLDKAILNKELDNTNEITLSHLHKNVVINFSVQDFIKPHQYDYSYLLKGISDEWINIGQEQKITFTQLPGQDFELGVKAKDQFGSWSKPRFITINVITPFWKKPYMLIGLGLLSFMVIYQAMKYRTKKIKERNRLLEETVKKRTFELIEQNQRLEKYIESNKNLESFAHAASHDIKTPLRSIASFAGLLKRRLTEKLDQKEFSYFAEIEKGATRLNKLVEDILAFSKLGSKNLNLKKYYISDIILESIDSLKAAAKDSKASITFNDTDKKYLVNIDKIKISRVIQNILINALKFVDKGVHPRINVSLEENDQKLLVHIKDNGLGIAEKNHKYIFEMFKRIEHSSAYDGTGFGLPLSKKIMQSHNGMVYVKSKLGSGSTFTLEFPKYTSVKQISSVDNAHLVNG